MTDDADDSTPAERKPKGRISFDPETPNAVIYDVLSDVATDVIGEYIQISVETDDPAIKSDAKAKAIKVRQAKRNVDPDDREALITEVRRLEQERDALRGV
ncbi:hypothetical protein ACFOVU_14225 [Nocardiopsis sediminis]|uniref:Uncharacterized protein n=1 Tax=Nocardiopsis sediminis TaxID=1778267 RepID=A0ABV8FM11_9ACTN